MKFGFTEAGQHGSDVKFVKITGTGTLTATVPRHREVAGGTMRSILRQAAISEMDFLNA